MLMGYNFDLPDQKFSEEQRKGWHPKIKNKEIVTF
jgi:hypothetical protein